MRVDFIIVGQGICGTLLSRELKRQGFSVLVIDNKQPNSASRVASGLINPVTGKRLVKTWMADELIPFAVHTYRELEKELDVPLIHATTILDFHATYDAKDIFFDRLNESQPHLSLPANEEAWQPYFQYHYGVGQINDCWIIDLQMLLPSWRSKLSMHNELREESFDETLLELADGKVRYKEIIADKIIYCNGVHSAGSKYFSLLPHSLNKGEMLLVSIPNLLRHDVYKHGLKLVHWKDDLFWLGSSFAWKYEDDMPTAVFRQYAETQLKQWLQLPFEIVEHQAAERPSTLDYKPFVGFHPHYPLVGIFNGMGTKGCSQAPYFAAQFAQSIAGQVSLNLQVDIARFVRVLQRSAL